MKKVIFLCLLFCVPFSEGKCQDGKDFLLGIHVGRSVSNYRDSKSPLPYRGYDYATAPIVDWTVGVRFGYQILPKFWIVSGVSSVKTGMEIDFAEYESDTDNNALKDFTYYQKRSNRYYSVPVFLQYKSAGRVGFTANGGGYLGFIKSVNNNYFIRSIRISDGVTREAYYATGSYQDKSTINSVDYGALLGLGGFANISDKLELTFGIDFLIGLRKLDPKNDDTIIYDEYNQPYYIEDYGGISSKSKNQVTTFSIGLNYFVR